MAQGGLFSTYRQGENRVTGSMMAVFERTDLGRLATILGNASGESSLQLVSFDNQPGSGGRTTPDARIAGSFSLWFETKTVPNSVRIDQLQGHLEHFDDRPGTFERLFVVTPDVDEPAEIEAVADTRVIWMSFRDLSAAIDALLSDPAEVIPEREQLLLRELQTLFDEDGLVAPAQDVVVVAARHAYNEYLEYATYVCQPRRAFRAVSRFGFYRNKRIEPLMPQILYQRDEVELTRAEVTRLRKAGGEHDLQVAAAIEGHLALRPDEDGGLRKVFILSAPNSADTIDLGEPVMNPTAKAWVQGQRYVASEDLLAAQSTQDL